MRPRNFLAVTGLLLTGLVVAASAFLIRAQRKEATYPTRSAAVSDGAFARGWLPEFIPGDATEIREAHDLDTNEVWGRFRRGAWSPEAVGLAQVTPERVEDVWPRSPSADWWPELLVKPLQPELLRENDVRVYLDTRSTYGLLVFEGVEPDVTFLYSPGG